MEMNVLVQCILSREFRAGREFWRGVEANAYRYHHEQYILNIRTRRFSKRDCGSPFYTIYEHLRMQNVCPYHAMRACIARRTAAKITPVSLRVSVPVYDCPRYFTLREL